MSDKKVTKEFIQNVKEWIEADDKINEIREKTKGYTKIKKDRESFILEYLQSIDNKPLDLPDGGTLKRNVVKSQGPIKKEIIHKALTEVTGNSNTAMAMTEHILKSRPTTEKVSLKRSKMRAIKGSTKEEED
jgi:hypothetical protein